MGTKQRPRKDNHRTRVGQERSARTETRILEAALGVFAKMGPDAPKIDDFVAAAGISRGTFYNHFESVETLLATTCEWTTRELLHFIEGSLGAIESPVVRFGVGLRLFFAKACADRVWSLFVGRVWKLAGVEYALRDLQEGARRGHFRAVNALATHDLLFGGVREALLRIGRERVPDTYGDEMTEVSLQLLGAEPKRIAAALKYPLPTLHNERAAE